MGERLTLSRSDHETIESPTHPIFLSMYHWQSGVVSQYHPINSALLCSLGFRQLLFVDVAGEGIAVDLADFSYLSFGESLIE